MGVARWLFRRRSPLVIRSSTSVFVEMETKVSKKKKWSKMFFFQALINLLGQPWVGGWVSKMYVCPLVNTIQSPCHWSDHDGYENRKHEIIAVKCLRFIINCENLRLYKSIIQKKKKTQLTRPWWVKLGL